MKWLKLAFISVIVFSGMLLLLSLLFPSQVFVSRAIQISRPAKTVLAMIDDPQLWKQWNPYVQNDSFQTAALILKEGKDIFIVQQGDKNAVKEIIIDKHLADGIEYSLKLSSHTETGNIIVTARDSSSCEVRWTQWKKAKYPWQKFSFFYQEKIYGPVLEKGLEELKRNTARE
jgi:hypothetical protein